MGLGRGALLWLLGIPLANYNSADSFLALKVWPMWQVRFGHMLAVLRSNRRRFRSLLERNRPAGCPCSPDFHRRKGVSRNRPASWHGQLPLKGARGGLAALLTAFVVFCLHGCFKHTSRGWDSEILKEPNA